jgi:RNA polymerase sigma factor (sigma-70 family)
MSDHRNDADLVAAHLGGDRGALAAIYDRYADALHDTAAAMLRDRHDAEDLTHDVFVIASRRLEQLRDPARLKPWLFAILRHEVYRRTKRRGRERPIDLTDPTVGGAVDMAAAHDPSADAGAAERDELAAFVREAAGGLAERDQLLLELSVRQGLTGADLADAVGVTPQQCHVLVHRMRDRVERSIGALTVARYGRRDCDELQRLLGRWDGRFDPPTRKRIAGHIDQCDTCERTSRRFAVIPLFAAAPVLAAPPSLRDRVLASTAAADHDVDTGSDHGYRFDAAGGFPRLAAGARRAVPAATLAVAMLLVVGGVWLASAAGDDGRDLADGAIAAGAVTAAPATTAPPTPSTPPSTTPSTTASDAPSSAPSTAPSTAPPSVPPTTAPASTAPASTAPPPSVPPSTASALPPPPAPDVAPPATTTTTPTTTTTAPPTTTVAPPPPGNLALSTTTIDLGATATSGRVQLTNTGGTALTWSIIGDTGPFRLSATTGTLAAGATADVVASIDRSALNEGSVRRGLTVASSAAGGAPITLAAAVERGPTVTITTVNPTSIRCATGGTVFVGATVADESAIRSVEVQWSGPGAGGSSAMTLRSGTWSGRAAPELVNGTWSVTVVASDARGNVGEAGTTVEVFGC